MLNSLNNFWHILLIYFPIGIIGLWRWSIWIVKKIVSLRYKPIANNNYTATLSIVTPVYNEDPELFKNALESWKQNCPDEIIAVIDYSDKDCIEEFKKFQQKNKIGRLIITKRPGKREALADGIRMAKYDIIALVDSDTIWEPNIKKIMLAPFKDSLVGGVGPRQDVLDINTLARKLFNIHIDHRYYDEMTYLATVANGLTCISGRTAVYRANAIKNLCDDLENETFCGTKCISGDDKCLTRLIQQDGWKVKYQANALVLTPGASDLFTLLKQQTRWTRNTYRSDLKSLKSKWIWKREKFLAFHMIDRFTQPFTLVLGPIYFILSILWGHWLMAGILLIWWHFSRSIKLYPHLKNRPADILILPVYIFTTYLLAVLKIYAMVTIKQQGWITRWDKSRLQSHKNKFFRLLKIFMPYTATASIILLLSFGVVSYKNVIIDDNQNINIVKQESTIIPIDITNNIIHTDIANAINFSDVSKIDTEKHKQDILDELAKEQFGYYTIKKKDTLAKIARRYNGNVEVIIEANKNILYDPNYLKIDQQIIIPVSELRNTLEKDKLVSRREPEIIFDKAENIINVKGEGSIVTLSKIYNTLNNKQLLEKPNTKEWLLKTNLLIGRDVTFVLDGDEVSWLKLLSEDTNFVIIRSYNGRILIKDTKITSWDEERQEVDNNPKDGRSLILAKYDGRMDVVNSELAFLGYGYYGTYLQGQPFGGSYGISWKIPNDSFKNYLITGNTINSKFHDNYFGVYTFGATGMIFKNNELYNNIEYGFDPHDDSNNFIIENNIVYDNGNHGMIVSRRCFNNTFRNNTSYNNKLHGIMLDKQSNNNLIENNVVYGNVDGIAVHDNSNNNLIRNNEIRNNENGIRVNVNSSGNYIEQNNITNNENGVFIYKGASNNFIVNNLIKENIKGVYIKNANNNLIKSSLKNDNNEIEIKLGNDAQDNLIQKIPQDNIPVDSIIIDEPIIIDAMEDISSLGFSGQRKIVEDKDGNFYVAYRKKYNGYYQIFIAKLNNNERIVSETERPITFIEADQRVPSIAIDSKDILHVVWYGSNSKDNEGNRQIKYSKSTDGGKSWTKQKNIAYVAGHSNEKYWQEHPNIFVGNNDKLYVVWEGKDLENRHQQIKFSKSLDNGQSWTKWINIFASPDNTQSRPSITRDSIGKLHLLMYSSLGGGVQQIQYTYSEDDGLNWNDWKSISNSLLDARHVSVVIDNKDNLHVVWRSPNYPDGPTQIHYTVLNNNKWSVPIIILSSVNYQFFPSITVDKLNTPYIIWMESEEKYDFPKERPMDGKIYFSYLVADKFSEANLISSGNYNFYPNFSNQYREVVSIIYSKEVQLSEIIFKQLFR